MATEYLSPCSKKHRPSSEDMAFSPFFEDGSSRETQQKLFNAIFNSLTVLGGQLPLILTSTFGPSDVASQFNDRYKILKEVGDGGFGTVFQCMDVANGHFNYAVKVIRFNNLENHERRTLTSTINREIDVMRMVKVGLLTDITNYLLSSINYL